MGASQSAADEPPQQKMKACYYELLAVDRHATDEEIKKAYRKKALELHPDRNYGNVDDATRLFAEVQSAYEVLSDPQERAWYDSHRDAILRDDDEASPNQYEHNVRVTTTEDIMRIFTKFNPRMGYSDSPTGFFSVLRGTFDTLAREEVAACEWEGLDPAEYPSFGNAKDSYEDVVRPFYAAWNGFATKKSFSWKDAFRYSEAPDRRVRRMMEKENKRLRDEGVREFNEAVRSLVAFVRKRDPRYIQNKQTEAERQQFLRDAAAAQAVRSRAANHAKLEDHVEAEWSKSREPDEEEDDSNEEIEEQFECVACGKTFKSEKQFEAHEKSKKHLKTLQYLRKQMQRENKELGLDNVTGSGLDTPDMAKDELEEEDQDPTSEIGQEKVQKETNSPGASQMDGLNDRNADEIIQPSFKSESPLSVSSVEKYSGDEYAPRGEVESRLADHIEQLTDATAAASIASDSSTPRKVGKAKEKRARKAAQQNSAAGGSAFMCATCNERFPSRTKLFTHVKDEGHAQYVPKAATGSSKGKKR